MRFRVALAAVLVFALVDIAQGFGWLGNTAAVVRRSGLVGDRLAVVRAEEPTTDAPVTTTTATSVPATTDAPTTTPSVPPTTLPPMTLAPTTTKAPPPDPVVAHVVGGRLEVFRDPSDKSP